MSDSTAGRDWLGIAKHVAGLPEQAASRLLGDRDLRVREAAGSPHGRGADARRDRRVADTLVPGLEDAAAIVRAAVLRALGRLLTPTGVVARLCEEFRSYRRSGDARASTPSPICRRSRQRAIWRGLAEDPDPDVPLALIQTADLISDPDAVMHYLASDEDPPVRDAAQNWFVRSGRRPS